MLYGAARVGGEDVGGVLNPWRAFVECIVYRCERRIFGRGKGNVMAFDAVDDDCDWRLRGGLHGCGRALVVVPLFGVELRTFLHSYRRRARVCRVLLRDSGG